MISLYYCGATIGMTSKDYVLVVYFGNRLVVLSRSNLNLLLTIFFDLLSRLKIGISELAVLNCSNLESQGCKIHQERTIDEWSCSPAVAECYAVVGFFLDAFSYFEEQFICKRYNLMSNFSEHIVRYLCKLHHLGYLDAIIPFHRLLYNRLVLV